MSAAPKQFYRRTLPEKCLSFSSEEGKKVFTEALTAGYMNSYFGLASQFRTQDEPAYCGLSTLVMVLNTLEVDPKRVWKGPWRWYHENMLDCCVPLEVVKTAGINLEQFACLATCNTLSISTTRADSKARLETLRETVKRCTHLTDEIIVTSYSRKVLKQTGDGHYSPIAGYHPEKDLVLILDTARFKYPPYWITLSLLWEAMQALDKDTGLPRGYFVMTTAATSPLVMFRIAPYLSVTLPQTEQVDQALVSFRHKWEGYICSDVSSDASDENTVVRTTVFKLLEALSELKDTRLLSTQVDLRCTANLSDDHSCALKTLVKSIAGIALFDIVRGCLQERPELISVAACAGESSISKQICSNRGSKDDDESALRGEACGIPPLDETHFITMLLLSWPSQKCGNTVGQAIQKAVSAQLASSERVLQNEAAQLRHQFESVFGYLDQCQDCKCKTNC